MENPDSNTNREKINTLLSEVFKLNNIPTAEEAKEENKANGIDTSNLQKWAMEKLEQAKAEADLEKKTNKHATN